MLCLIPMPTIHRYSYVHTLNVLKLYELLLLHRPFPKLANLNSIFFPAIFNTEQWIIDSLRFVAMHKFNEPGDKSCKHARIINCRSTNIVRQHKYTCCTICQSPSRKRHIILCKQFFCAWNPISQI